jgi:DNA-binding MarR family transcriptional regulator
MTRRVPVIADDVMRAWRLLLEVHHRLTQEMDQELRDGHGLRLDWYDVLVQLDAGGGRMRMHELAEATLFSRTDCTRIVDRMERAGLVAREPALEDGRGIYAVLTAAGRRMLREAAVTHVSGIERCFAAQVSEEEAATIAQALQRVVNAAP